MPIHTLLILFGTGREADALGGILCIAAAFMIGSYFSSRLALLLPEILIRRVFSVLLVIMAVRMFFGKGT